MKHRMSEEPVGPGECAGGGMRLSLGFLTLAGALLLLPASGQEEKAAGADTSTRNDAAPVEDAAEKDGPDESTTVEPASDGASEADPAEKDAEESGEDSANQEADNDQPDARSRGPRGRQGFRMETGSGGDDAGEGGQRPGPGFRPGAGPGARGAAAGEDAPGGPLGDRVSLQFPLNPVNDLLNIYERLIEKSVVKDSSVFEGPQVSLVTPVEVSRDEAIQLIEATLLVNGYVIVSEPGENSVKVLRGGERQAGQSAAFSEGVVIYTDAGSLPSGESLVGYFMELDYVDPEDAAALFGNHVVLNDFGRITPVSNPRGLLITESTPIVRQLIRLRTIIDHPVEDAPLITEFVNLEHAEANVVAQIIQAAMDARMEERERQGESGRTVTGQRAQRGGEGSGNDNDGGGNNRAQDTGTTRGSSVRGQQNLSPGASLSGIGTADQPAAQLIPDDRLNRIMVVASPTDAAYVLQMIHEFDQPLDVKQPVERPLRYVKANDILPVIVDVLQDTGTGQTQLPGGRQIASRPTPVTSSQLATLTGQTQGAQTTQAQAQGQGQAAATGEEVGGRPDQISFPIDEVAPISVLVGKTRVIADRQANSIIVVGNAEAQEIALDMIDRLDQRPVQVYLATVIGEMTLGDDVQFGMDYLQQFVPWQRDRSRGGFTSGNINSRGDIIGATNTTGNIADLAEMLVTTPFGPAGGLNFYGQIGQSLDVVVTALEQTNRFTVLSRPVVYTQNGKRAEITSGQEVPYPESTLSDTNNPNAVRSTTAFKEVVLKLEVLPTINDDDEVTLDIVQINDRIVGEQEIDQNVIPIIGKQELNTTVSVANRSTIVLGGLISETDNKDEAGIPLLSKVPILGNAAKNSNREKSRSELMIFIQPVVVRGHREAVEQSYDEDVRTEVGESAAETFPEPGAPTLRHREEMIEEEELENQPLRKLGQKLFGKKKKPHKPLPVARPVESSGR